MPGLVPGIHVLHKPQGADFAGGKIVFQSFFMSAIVQPLATPSSSALSSLPTLESRS